MSIVKMRKFRLLAPRSEKDELLRQLLLLGCVEVDEPSDLIEDENDELSKYTVRSVEDASAVRLQIQTLSNALDLLDKYAPAKKKMLAPKPTVNSDELLDSRLLTDAEAKAKEICRLENEIRDLAVKQAAAETTIQTLKPWCGLDMDLSDPGTQSAYVIPGTMPVGMEVESVSGALAEQAPEAELISVGEDEALRYLLLVAHYSAVHDAQNALRPFGFSPSPITSMKGTPLDNKLETEKRLEELKEQAEQNKEQIKSFKDDRQDLRKAVDIASTRLEQCLVTEKLLLTDHTLCLAGWVPAPQEKELTDLMEKNGCAWEITDPTPEEYEKVPISLKNGPLTRCMNVVTEMYSLPAYDGVDPNPLMAPFFIVFFGLMMADMAYGILMILASVLVLKKSRPKGTARNFMELVLLCGITTFVFGALTGGFFGDFIPQIARIINPESTLTLPHLFTPLDDTVAILIGSLILGVIQVITGMIISFVKKIRDGHPADAIWDEGSWWVVLIGLAMMILGVGNVGGFPVVLVIGALMLIYGSTRNAKGFGKVSAFIGAIYNGVTGYFSDILSYLRLMALMLAGSVIAQVFNTLGAVFGNVVVFVIISLIGNALNLALNLLGCFVHDLRLQCLEYFGRFYKEGGKPFKPLSVKSKYYDIIKEEQ